MVEGFVKVYGEGIIEVYFVGIENYFEVKLFVVEVMYEVGINLDS